MPKTRLHEYGTSMAQQKTELTEIQIYLLVGVGLVILVGIATMIAGSFTGGLVLICSLIGILLSIAGIVGCIYLFFLFFKFLRLDWMF